MGTLVDIMIQVVTDQICTNIAKEAEFAMNFRSQFEQMKKGLGTMKALLADTETLKREYERIRVALSQLRDVIYEADNVLTDCLVRDEYKKNWFLALLHDPFFWHRMSKKLTEINSEMEKIERTLDQHLKPRESAGGSHGAEDMEFKSQDCGPSVTYGLEEEIKKLKEWIHESTKGELDYFGIVGMGGLGKTTIAQKIFQDEDMVRKFDKMIWVCVSQNFNGKRIVKRMLERAGKTVLESDIHHMLSSLKQVLEDENYLIVMDDVWRDVKLWSWWNDLCDKLPKKVGKTSCIIITTRDEKVAKQMVLESSKIYQPRPLKNQDSWCLFSEYAFKTSKGKCPNKELHDEANKILKKCGGLPLAIKTIGGLLAKKNNSLFEWRKTSERFHEMTIEGDTEFESVMCSLQLSYDELPNTRLKQCLLCFSIYPEDFEIPAEQLIHWWIAEGIIQSNPEYGSKTAIEMGYECLSELVSRCLVEAVERRGYDGRVYKCKIHDMVRQLIIKIAEEEAFCSFNPQGMQVQREDSRWLCFTDHDMETEDHHDEKPSMIKTNPKLRVLFLMSSPPTNFGTNFEFLQSLRVLDLSYSKLDVLNVEDSATASSVRVDDLFRWISRLKRLACLNLSRVQNLREVPCSIEKLLNLQILVLNGCNNLVKIHSSITSLKRLIVLDLGTSTRLDYLPKGLGRLSNLQELSGFRVVTQAKTRTCALLELGKLKQLRVLRIIISDAIGIGQVSTNIEMGILTGLTNLKVLAIDANECKKKETLEMFGGLPPNLEELYLSSYYSKTMPNWFTSTKLRRLHYLCVENCHIVKLIPSHCTWSIEGLCLKLLNMLEEDWDDMMLMPALRYMEISNCSELKNLPHIVRETRVWRK